MRPCRFAWTVVCCLMLSAAVAMCAYVSLLWAHALGYVL